jgi:hypothetical protein
MGGCLHSPIISRLRKNPPLPIELEAGCVPKSVWMLGIREKYLASCENQITIP